MNFKIVTTGCVLLLSSFLSLSAGAATPNSQNSIIPIGQGVSSPSIISGLGYENVAGLSANSSFRVDGQLGVNDNSSSKGGGGILMGNGMFGAGLQYSKLRGYGSSEISWGVAGRFSSLAIGVAGHHPTEGGDGTFDLGALFDVTPDLRLGFQVPDFTHDINELKFGFTKGLSSNFDFTVDSSYYSKTNILTLTPALGIHVQALQLSAGYGFRVIGDIAGFYKKDFSAAAGVTVSQNVALSYEYKGLATHLFSLFIGLN